MNAPNYAFRSVPDDQFSCIENLKCARHVCQITQFLAWKGWIMPWSFVITALNNQWLQRLTLSRTNHALGHDELRLMVWGFIFSLASLEGFYLFCPSHSGYLYEGLSICRASIPSQTFSEVSTWLPTSSTLHFSWPYLWSSQPMFKPRVSWYACWVTMNRSKCSKLCNIMLLCFRKRHSVNVKKC